MTTSERALAPGYAVRRWRLPPDDPAAGDFARRVAGCYRQVFGRDPVWNAGRWCPPCSTPSSELRFNFDRVPERCPRCGGPLADRWPEAELVEKFADDLRRPAAFGFVAVASDEVVVGATTCLVMPAAQIADYLDLPPPVAAQMLSRVPPGDRVGFLDLSFVLAEHQRRGVGAALHRARRAACRALPHPPRHMMLRTARTPPSSVYAWRLRQGYRVVAEYRDFLDRVLLARPL